MKMKKTEKTVFIIFISILVAFGVKSVIVVSRNNEKLKSEPVVFLRSSIIKYNVGYQGGDSYEIKYRFKEDDCVSKINVPDSVGILGIEEMHDFVGQQYYLKVLKSDPEVFEFLIHHPVKDTTLIQPPEGWDVLPE